MINRSALLELLTRYETQQCTPAEKLLVEQWYELLGEQVEMPLTEQQWANLEQQLWLQVKPGALDAADKEPVTPLWRRFLLIASGVAAIITIVVGIAWYQQSWLGSENLKMLVNQSEAMEWTRYFNETTQGKEIKLSDGSSIILAPKAQLAVHKDFNKTNRNIRLLGNAFFNVHNNPSQPFLVYSGDIITKVLGTTFQIRASNPAEPIQVTVKSGKVTVYRQQVKETTANITSRGVILTPNQKATYFPDNEQFVTEITEDPQPISFTENKSSSESLVFNETPIGEVIHRLEILYGTEIELEQASLNDCPFTGNLTSQSLYKKLELLCGTINGAYEIRGTTILVTGKGCQ